MADEAKTQKTHSAGDNASSLLGLFAPPSPPTPAQHNRRSPFTTLSETGPLTPSRNSTPQASLPYFPGTSGDNDATNSMPPRRIDDESTAFRHEQTPLLLSPSANEPGYTSHLQSLFAQSDQQSPPSPPHSNGNSPQKGQSEASFLSPILELPLNDNNNPSKLRHHRKLSEPSSPFFSLASMKELARNICAELSKPSTWVGTFMFLLFQVVFSLTMGATITRPHGTVSILGLMTKMAAIGIIFGAPVYWIFLPDVPAIYPTVDLFAAPFMAKIAVLVDEALFLDPTVAPEEMDEYFLGSYTLLASLSLVISGTLLVLTSVFKLADLGSYLPFPVLCGFFTAAGVMTWMLAFKVDTHGLSISHVLLSGDTAVMGNSLLHHAPSVFVAVVMKYLGPKNPFYVVMLVLATIGTFYVIMFTFGITMDEMREWEWFYSPDDLVYKPMFKPIGFSSWATPAPFGWINSLFQGHVHWGAVAKGLETSCALSLLYLIRCSLHGAALKKNVPNLSRVEKVGVVSPSRLIRASSNPPVVPKERHQRTFSEAIDIESVVDLLEGEHNTKITTAKPMTSSLRQVLLQYGNAQFVCGLVGSYAVTPCVAASPTMFSLGAEGLAPQIGSVLLLFYFYLTSFQIVSFVPKPAFSCLLVLAFIDMVSTWFIKSYFKTKEKMEWLVVPTIVILTFVFSLLQAVFIGLALSTFLFVAAFFRSGVVKYVANGLTIRSTIERSPKASSWLDSKADQIQIIVLQNYLFFGNASSIPNYVSTMFEEPEEEQANSSMLPPIPKIVILDLTLVTGMDTSAVDAFAEIVAICKRSECKVFLAGVNPGIREIMRLNGLKPEATRDRSLRMLRFFLNLDSAIGKGEDLLMELMSFVEDSPARGATPHQQVDGFYQTLCLIDEQHHVEFAKKLSDLKVSVTAMKIARGEVLYEDHHLERGLFFIEKGIMKIERESGATLSRNGTFMGQSADSTLTNMKARTGSIGQMVAKLKLNGRDGWEAQRFRVARVGPGWVLGSLEALGGTVLPRNVVAVTDCLVHHLSYRKLEQIEVDNPAVSLNLYKLLSLLTAKRQEALLSQLGTLHSIMSAPAKKKPIGRSDSAGSARSLWFGAKED